MDRITILKTINVLSLALLILYLIFDAKWLLWMALLLAIGNTLESRITSWIATYWMKFASLLGNVNSRIILTVIFFVVLTPLAVVYRLFHRDMIDHFRANKRKSYFDDLNKTYPRSDFEKLW